MTDTLETSLLPALPIEAELESETVTVNVCVDAKTLEDYEREYDEAVARGDVALPTENAPEAFAFEVDCFNEKDQEDKLWQAKTGLNYDTLCGAIETIVFMSDKPVSIQKIKQLVDPDMPLRVIHDAIARLQDEYERAHHGIRLSEVAQGYQFRTKATFARYVQDIFKVNALVLSPVYLETLALIAYKQPITKTDLEKVRGVDSSHIIRGLMDKRLVRIVGRSEDIGRPTLYGTTDEFLEVFNLASIKDLPPEYELEELATRKEVAEISEIKQVVGGNKSIFNFDDIQELDELRETIKSISEDTEFTKSLHVETQKRISEDGTPVKSAFELLEEFIDRDIIRQSNLKSVVSDVLTSVADARSVDVTLTDEMLNAPNIDEDESAPDFEELLVRQDATPAEAISELKVEVDFVAMEASETELIDIDEKMDALDGQSDRIVEEASAFDLDLGFMKSIEDVPETHLEATPEEYH